MDALKLIPQFFLDVLARIIPGSLLLISISYLTGESALRLVFAAFNASPALQDSVVVWTLAVVASSYFSGHMISYFVRLLEKPDPLESFRRDVLLLLRRKRSSRADAGEELAGDRGLTLRGQYYENMKRVLDRELSGGDAYKYSGTVFVWYDWLRLYHPEAGAITAKIRSEYMMYGGTAVVMILTLLMDAVKVVYEVWRGRWHDLQPSLFVIVMTLGIPFTLLRHRLTLDTFYTAVINFYYSAQNPPPAHGPQGSSASGR